VNQQTISSDLRTIGDKQRQETAEFSRRADALPLLVLGLWFVAQFCLFYQYAQREVLWAFPGHWDQVRYLQESHDIYRDILANGLPRGLVHAVATPTPTGNLLPAEAAVLYLFLGGSRLTALLVLFAHWIALQIVAVAVIRWLSGRWSLAAIGLAMLLLVASQFRREGSLVDFRIDYAAYCAYAVLICLVIRSNIFANRRTTLLAAVVASYLILLRFITLVYLGAISAVFLMAATVLWVLRWRQSPITTLAKRRMMSVLLALAVVCVICTPVFWHDWRAIHNYYFLGTAREKYIRAKDVGIQSQLDSILFYPNAVWTEHAGPDFRQAAIALVLLALLAIGWRRLRGGAADSSPLRDRLDMPLAYLVFSACLLGPYLVLTSDVNKATYVGNIFIPPLWAMVMLAVVCAAESIRSPSRNQWLRHVPTGLAVVLMGTAISYQASSYNQPSRYTQQRQDIKRVLELHDLIGEKCQELGLQSPAIGVDVLSDAFYPGVVNATQRERHQIRLSAYPAYPSSVSAVTEDEVMPGLHEANFVLLTLSGDTQNSVYPFDKSMEALRPKMLAICDSEMIPLRETSFFGRRVRLYMRPSLRVEPTWADWLGEDGTLLYGNTAELRQFPSITLRGATFGNVHFPDDGHTLAATLEIEDRPPMPIPATYADTNGQYTIHLSIPPLDTPSDVVAAIRLHFNRFFVPKELGVNDDIRHLVVNPPNSVHLDRQ
jgi:hypothetical protein